MKTIFTLIVFVIFNFSYSQDYTLLQINAKWNSNNTFKLQKAGDTEIKLAWLEEQPEKIQKNIKSVPVLILFKDGKPAFQWNGGINLKLNIKEEDIVRIIEKTKNR